ncbi:MAG: crcB3 [Frankiales bacterium]|nr:crcB3 [Frankiales bacterium]
MTESPRRVGPDDAVDVRHRPGLSPFEQPAANAWPRLPLAVLAAVFVGGCVGTLARYEVTETWSTPAHHFPWATFAINSSGAFALALLLVLVLEVLPPSTYLRPLLGTGFCGAWTTFSSIVASADQLIAHGHARLGASYVVSSAVAGLAAAFVGLVVGRSIGASRHRDHDRKADRGAA